MGALGAVLGLSWASLGALLGHLGAILRPRMAIETEKARKPKTLIFSRFWKDVGLLGISWERLGRLVGASWGLLGPSWGALAALLGDFQALLGPSWRRSIKEGESLISAAPLECLESPLGPLLRRSWSALGRSWGRLGALLGLSWGPLGPSRSHLEASDGHRKRKGEKAKNIDFR